MTPDSHERARLLITLPGTETDQLWLGVHLESCPQCREFAGTIEDTIRGLRAIPITADFGLVSRTQARLRLRARELRQRRERQWVMGVCCAAVTLCTAFTSVLLWLGFAWMGRQARLAAPVWGACYLAFCFVPAILTGIVLLSRGTHLADERGGDS